MATPGHVAGDGLTTVTVTARPTEGGSPVDGATVHFALEVQGGVPGAPTSASWEGADPGTPTRIDAGASQGAATATVRAPRQGFGALRFTASFSSQGLEPSASVSVPLQPAGGPARSLTFICQHQNVGALVHGRQTDIHVLCRATALDAANHVIPNASVQTLAEAGRLDWLRDSFGVQEFVYTVRPDDPPPLDVDPLDADGKEQDFCPAACQAAPFGPGCTGEPCWADATGPIHNPRDGIATLIAAAPAEDGFDDSGEPFVDRNDNGTRDPGEPYIDYDGNGKWDGPSGQARPHMVWKEVRMVWSGEASASATGSATPHDVFLTAGKDSPATHPDGTVTVKGATSLRLFDRNFNQLAAAGPVSSDGIGWSSGCSGDGSVTFTVSDQFMEQISPGILLSADTGAILLPGSRSTWTQKTDYENGFTFTGTPGQTCTLDAQTHRAWDPGAPGFDAAGADPDVGVGLRVSF